MKIFTLFLVFIFSGFSLGQTTNPTPASTPVPMVTPNPIPIQIFRRPPTIQEREQEQLALKEQKERAEKMNIARRIINDLYRNPNSKEMQLLAVDNALKVKFADFLKNENTGLIKLFPTLKCAESPSVVVVSDVCIKYTMPGAGSSFSFRVKNYRIPSLADLSLSGNNFLTTGKWLHTIFVNIGDIPLNAVNLQTKGVSFLSNVPPDNYEKAKDLSYKLVKGINQDNFFYINSIEIRQNVTYVLRSIAYRGVFNKTAEGVVYNEFDYDKRKDIIVAFRVVERDIDGSITILWRRLSVKDSPKILLPSTIPDAGIKENKFLAQGLLK